MLFKSLMLSSLLALVASQQLRKSCLLSECDEEEKLGGKIRRCKTFQHFYGFHYIQINFVALRESPMKRYREIKLWRH